MDWDKWSKIATVFAAPITLIAVLISFGALIFTMQSTSQSLEASAQSARESASLNIRSWRLQTNLAAQQRVEEHYAFAAEEGVDLVGSDSDVSVSEEAMDRVAQHGLRTASLVYDLTEGGPGRGEILTPEFAAPTGEFDEMKSFGRLVLESYEDNLRRSTFPCEVLDDEFVEFAREEVKVDPCQGPV